MTSNEKQQIDNSQPDDRQSEAETLSPSVLRNAGIFFLVVVVLLGTAFTYQGRLADDGGLVDERSLLKVEGRVPPSGPLLAGEAR